MNKHLVFKWSFLVGILCSTLSFAQPTYTDLLYSFRLDTGITYGTAINYAGFPVELKLDLYKPVGDLNLKRPLLVLVHGGSWIGGTRDDNDISSLAPGFARRGYVVASVSYRLGFHPSDAGGSNIATCSAITPQLNCVYPADSSEIVRAIYRGMQDVKGAIRFLKARSAEDSTCSRNVYLAGVSAGGFCALAAAFLDTISEKPIAAGVLSDAVDPASTLSYCQNFYNPPGSTVNRSRPDLGSIEGDLNLNGYSSGVNGVANFYGGMIHDYLAEKSGLEPLFYFFHQTTDVIVNCNYAPLLSSLSYDCLDPFAFLGCKHIWNTPRAFGSCGIRNLISSNAYPIEIFDAIANNGGPNCLASPTGHSILNPALRVAEISQFFSQRIQVTEQLGCETTVGNSFIENSSTTIFPNPANTLLTLEATVEIKQVEILDLTGRPQLTVLKNDTNLIELDLSALAPGIYLLKWVTQSNRTEIRKFMKQSAQN